MNGFAFLLSKEELQRRFERREAFNAKWNAIGAADSSEGCSYEDVEYVDDEWPRKKSERKDTLGEKSVLNEAQHDEKPTEPAPSKVELTHDGKMERVQEWIKTSSFLTPPDLQSESQLEQQLEPLPESKPEAQAESIPTQQPESKPKAQAESKPTQQPESKPKQQPELQPESLPESKPESKPEKQPELEPELLPELEPEQLPESKTEQEHKVIPRPVNANRLRSDDVLSIYSASTVVAPIKRKPTSVRVGRFKRSSKLHNNLPARVGDNIYNCFVSLSRISELKRPESRTDVTSVCVSASESELTSECRFPALRLAGNCQTRPKPLVADSLDSRKPSDNNRFEFDKSKPIVKSDQFDRLHSISGVKTDIVTVPESELPIGLVCRPSFTQPNDGKYEVSLPESYTSVSGYNLCLSTLGESVPSITVPPVKSDRSTKHNAVNSSTSVELNVTASESVAKSRDTRVKHVASSKQSSTLGPRLETVTAKSVPKTSVIVDNDRTGTLRSNLSSDDVNRKSSSEKIPSNCSKKTGDRTEKYALVFKSRRDTSDDDSDAFETERIISNSKREIKSGTNESVSDGFKINDEMTRKRAGENPEQARTKNKNETVEEQVKRIFPKAKHWISESSVNLSPVAEETRSEKYAMVFKTVDSDEEFLALETRRVKSPWQCNEQTSRWKSGTNDSGFASTDKKKNVSLRKESAEILTNVNEAVFGLERTPVKRSSHREIPRKNSTPKKGKYDKDTGIFNTENDGMIDLNSMRRNIDIMSRINSTPRQSDKKGSAVKIGSAMRKLDINKVVDTFEKLRKSPVARNTSCDLFRSENTVTSQRNDSAKDTDIRQQIEFDIVSSSDEWITKKVRSKPKKSIDLDLVSSSDEWTPNSRRKCETKKSNRKNIAEKSTKLCEISADRFDTNKPVIISSSKEENVANSSTKQSVNIRSRRSNSRRRQSKTLTIGGCKPLATSDSEEARGRTSVMSDKRNKSLECTEKIHSKSKTFTEEKSETRNVENSSKLSAGNGIRFITDSDNTSDDDFVTESRYKKKKYVRYERKCHEDSSNSVDKLNVENNSDFGNMKMSNNFKTFNCKLGKSSNTPEMKNKDRKKVPNKFKYRTVSSKSSGNLSSTAEIIRKTPEKELPVVTDSSCVNDKNNKRTESEVNVKADQKNVEINKTNESIGCTNNASRTEIDRTLLDSVNDVDFENSIPATVIKKVTTKRNVTVSEKTNLTSLIDELSVTSRNNGSASKRIVIEFELASSDDELGSVRRSKKGLR